MRKVLKILVVMMATLALATGCSLKQEGVSKQAAQQQSAAADPAPVKQDPKLAITTAEVEQLMASQGEKGIFLVDARPAVKFNQGHVPGAVSIPKPLLSQSLDQLPKGRTVIFYCGGLHCPLSSASAQIALENGFEDVRVWYEGMPGWLEAGNFAVVELPYVQKLVTEGDAPFLLVDARPAVKYQQAFIPGAVSIPKVAFEQKQGLLPADRDLPLIFYCGGYKCNLSRQSAEMALAKGYRNVSVFEAGEPAWRAAGLALWGNEPAGMVAVNEEPAEGLPEEITAEEFETLVEQGACQIVDVRSPEEFAQGHIKGAINIFDEDFIFKTEEAVARLATDKRVVLLCGTGSRAASAYYAILGESNYANKDRLQYLDCAVTFWPDGHFMTE